MTGLRGIPPGRAGRLWLQRRLSVAQRAADLLDQKLRVLRQERERFALLAERTGEEWEQRCRDAETWLLRGALLGGQPAIGHAASGQPADVTVSWTTVMGVRYPDAATCATPEPPYDIGVGNAALLPAVRACSSAVDAAVRHAAATAALRTVDAEMLATRRRLRAVQDRWIPRLESALAEVRLGLEEADRTEGVRRRWAAGSGSGWRTST